MILINLKLDINYNITIKYIIIDKLNFFHQLNTPSLATSPGKHARRRQCNSPTPAAAQLSDLAPPYTVVPSALHRGLAPLLLCMQSRSRVGRRTPRWDACMPPRCRNISSGWYLLATWQEIFSIRRDLDARFYCSYIDKIKRLLYVICCNQIVNKILHAWFV